MDYELNVPSYAYAPFEGPGFASNAIVTLALGMEPRRRVYGVSIRSVAPLLRTIRRLYVGENEVGGLMSGLSGGGEL